MNDRIHRLASVGSGDGETRQWVEVVSSKLRVRVRHGVMTDTDPLPRMDTRFGDLARASSGNLRI